ncbi:2-oxo acid dehydrogenase subunit E2 [Bordetella petrii]|nr:2-oxo acid dehydrogenase subunit E2 [Bordetella petrii]
MKLFNYFRSSASYRVRIALEIKGLAYDYIPVHLVRAEHRQPAFACKAGDALLPALDLDGGPTLVQSMARRMTQAKQVPHFYLAAEAEVSELQDLRRRLNEQPGASRLTLNHFVIAAVARALHALPYQNRIWLDDQIVQFDAIDVGVAVSTERGLMAPVLHGLGAASLDDIAGQSDALLERVRGGRATREDMSGGAISVSNAGMFNVTYMTPIINPPQSAILGVGSIRQVFRPDDRGAPALKREMGLVLAADHRLHDGASALKFLNYIIELLQDPYRLLRNRIQKQG